MADPEDAGRAQESSDDPEHTGQAQDPSDDPDTIGEPQDPSDGPEDAGIDPEAAGEGDQSDAGSSAPDEEGPTRDELRERVEEAYDFESFGPAEMREMSAEEWEVAFDDEAWITGDELLDRVEADLRSRVAERDVFAVVERTTTDPPRLVAYSDEGYAVVDPDGTVEGRGTVLRDVKPTVALASMPDYEVDDPPADAGLPAPEAVPEGGGDLGNLVLQVLAITMGLCGLVLVGAPLVVAMGDATIIAVVAGLGFLLTAGFLGMTVANARLSARYRSEQYRDRLRAAGVSEGERPEFLPVDDHEFEE